MAAARGRKIKAGERARWGHTVSRFPRLIFESLRAPGLRDPATYALELVVVGATYFVLAKVSSTLGSINPGAIPIWPPAGFGLAVVLLRGLRVWPAIFVAALAAGAPTDIADATLADSILISSAIAVANTLEALLGGYLISIWSDGRRTFDTPTGIAKFASVSLGPSTMIGAAVGVGGMCLAGYADWANFGTLWVTWWLRDLAGALVIAPVIVLWALSDFRTFKLDKVLTSGIAASVVSLVAFSPLIEQTVIRTSLGFLAVLPLLWAAVRCGQRDTATAALVLSCFAVWGTSAGGGPFAGTTPNESFLPLITFMISTSFLSLALSADVTVRERVEAELRQQEQNLRTLVSQAVVGIEDLQETLQERTAALKKAGEVVHTEIEQRKRVEAALKHDILERRKAQEALMESEWRFRLVIQGVTDYAIFMLDPDGYITNWNVGAQRIHQYAAADIIGQHFGRFYVEEEQQRGEPARALQVAAYEGKYEIEGWRVRRDESQFWASVVIEAIRDEAGTLVGFVKITRDITERREAQASLQWAQEQLAQSQKMEALGQLTGSIAHDFNNLLMIVSGHAQLLRRRLTDPKHLQAIDALNSAANRGESLTRQLLAFSRRQPLNPVVADLKQRVEAVHEMLVGSLRGNVQLQRDIPADVWPVEVDVAELELALVNIAVNARDAMPGGGSVTLSVRNVTLKKSDGVDQLEGDFVALAMTDTGVGIAPDVLPKIFEPFFTTKALGKGTGLGLAQVYGFSHQSGGSVVATSTVGSGTAITIYLPRKHTAFITAAEASPAQPLVPGEGMILVVEDNVEVAAVTASLIEQLGYRTLRAENATDALNRLQRGDKIDLVFSDVVMPGVMNGIALAQEIGNRYPQIPVLLTSGYSDVVQTADSRFAILRKPFQLPALERFIRDALEGHGECNGGDRVVQFSRRSGTKDVLKS
jgi:PAS domain S-box-containing protein